ncbi:hypothetical protein [Bradyrhizobium sp. McL0616]|uniref:hypothetical protein n=1 Tax=Bradyrhizobium sp. McL0616 TaxID=3415674 RepID=UPI003CEFCA6D
MASNSEESNPRRRHGNFPMTWAKEAEITGTDDPSVAKPAATTNFRNPANKSSYFIFRSLQASQPTIASRYHFGQRSGSKTVTPGALRYEHRATSFSIVTDTGPPSFLFAQAKAMAETVIPMVRLSAVERCPLFHAGAHVGVDDGLTLRFVYSYSMRMVQAVEGDPDRGRPEVAGDR